MLRRKGEAGYRKGGRGGARGKGVRGRPMRDENRTGPFSLRGRKKKKKRVKGLAEHSAAERRTGCRFGESSSKRVAAEESNL